MKIVTGGVYDHERYGRVLVTGIAKMYQEWDTSGEGRRPSNDVLVYFQTGLEDYTAGDPSPNSIGAMEFEKEAEFVHRYESPTIEE